MTSKLPAIPTHLRYVHVLVLCKDESTYSEAVFGLDGCFRWGYDEPVIDDVEEWMPLPTRAAPEAPRQSEPAPIKCWSYKMGGEQRFYPSDPRMQDWGVNMSEYITDVEPLYTAPLSPDHSGGGAGVVLPEAIELLKDMRSGRSSLLVTFFDRIDACLDKVKELNK